MKRDKRTVYILPDLSRRVDEAAALGGVSPNAIVETALDEHFARESVYLAVEALTRRCGELEAAVLANQAALLELDRAVKAIGKGVAGLLRERGKVTEPEAAVQEPPEPAAEAAEQARAGVLAGLWGRR